MKYYKITVVAERIGTLLDMQQRNRQDHMVQLLQMDFNSVNISIEEIKDAIEFTNTQETGSISPEEKKI